MKGFQSHLSYISFYRQGLTCPYQDTFTFVIYGKVYAAENLSDGISHSKDFVWNT